MTEEEKKDRRVVITIDMVEELNKGAIGTKNLGYAISLAIYHLLGLDKFINARQLVTACLNTKIFTCLAIATAFLTF